MSFTLEILDLSKRYANSSLYVRLGKNDNVDLIAHPKEEFPASISYKRSWSLKYFLGLEIATSNKRLFLNQHKHILDFLADVGLQHAKPDETLLDSTLKLASVAATLNSPIYYHKLVEKLIYLTITIHDISFVVNLVSQHMQAPTLCHLCLVKRFWQYLKRTIGHGIVMTKNGHTNVMGSGLERCLIIALQLAIVCSSTVILFHEKVKNNM